MQQDRPDYMLLDKAHFKVFRATTPSDWPHASKPNYCRSAVAVQ